jgi:hypothetical protein
MSDRRQGRARAIERNVQIQMTDTRFNWMRRRTGRRALVGAMAVTIALGPVAWTLGGSLWGILSVCAAALVWWSLRISVRTVADLPTEFLDERQERARDRAYVEAYRILAAIAVGGASVGLLAFIVLGQDPDTWAVTLSWDAVSAVFWLLTASALALPSMVLAVLDRPETVEHDDQVPHAEGHRYSK